MCPSVDRVYCSVRMNGKCLNHLSVFFSSFNFFAPSFYYYYSFCPTKIYELLFSLFFHFCFRYTFFPPHGIFIKNEKKTLLFVYFYLNACQTHIGLEFRGNVVWIAAQNVIIRFFWDEKKWMWFRCHTTQAIIVLLLWCCSF